MCKFICSNKKSAFALFLLSTLLSIVSQAQTLTTLATFTGTDGSGPSALVQANDGNFYGTTLAGANGGAGTVFRITPDGTLTTLDSFCTVGVCPDEQLPNGLALGSDGNFYGTTQGGGAYNEGTVFKVDSAGTLTTLYSFSDGSDGADPIGNLIQAADGSFYGTTFVGPNGEGTVFKITPGGALTTLYAFCPMRVNGNCLDGAGPTGLIQANDGNFYGTTSGGGANTVKGVVFKITPAGVVTTLYNFCSLPGCADGANPSSPLVQGFDGDLYGTTFRGGGNDGGTVFKITLSGTLTTLYSLCSQPNCSDGSSPSAPLIQASDGNFYGTTLDGGASSGTVFKISPQGALTTVYTFCAPNGDTCPDGTDPTTALLQAKDGNLYGTTSGGGPSGAGTVFKLTLPSSGTPPAISPNNGVVSGASFQAGIASGSWITISGASLSSKTDTWANAIVNGNLPTLLDGVSVSVGGEPAYIYYISPTQINALAPNVATGTVPVTVTNSSGTSAPVNTIVQAEQPAFFQWGNYAVATTQDFSLAVKNGTFPGLTTTPAKPGEVIIFWGAGFGPTSPSAPAGVEVPSSTTYNTANMVTVTVGDQVATVYGAALAAGYAGLYQVAIQIPASLANGDYPVVAKVSGVQSPSTTLITVQN